MGFGGSTALLWATVVGLLVVGRSNGGPTDVNGITTDGQDGGNVDNVPPSGVLPQVGVLEDRADVSAAGKDLLPIIVATDQGQPKDDGTLGNDAAKGILVPIVSINDGTDAFDKPLVALLPAPSTSSEVPTAALPILPEDSASASVNWQMRRRRSITTGDDDGASPAETMTVAEDIVFRPLFTIRQAPRKNRRYNLNGYYRLPYNYPRSNYGDR